LDLAVLEVYSFAVFCASWLVLSVLEMLSYYSFHGFAQIVYRSINRWPSVLALPVEKYRVYTQLLGSKKPSCMSSPIMSASARELGKAFEALDAIVR
jgi:hypothetical protein